MHLLEMLFGISPDNGSGVTECFLLLALAVAAVVLRHNPVLRAARVRSLRSTQHERELK